MSHTVNDKMTSALQDNAEMYASCGKCSSGDHIGDIGIDNPDDVVTEIINSLWTDYEKHDITSWPDDGQMVLVKDEGMSYPHVLYFFSGPSGMCPHFECALFPDDVFPFETTNIRWANYNDLFSTKEFEL